jgi:hypothetical protein
VPAQSCSVTDYGRWGLTGTGLDERRRCYDDTVSSRCVDYAEYRFLGAITGLDIRLWQIAIFL